MLVHQRPPKATSVSLQFIETTPGCQSCYAEGAGAVLRRLRNLRAFINSHKAAVKPRNRQPGTRINSIGQAMAGHHKPSNLMHSGRQNQKMCILAGRPAEAECQQQIAKWHDFGSWTEGRHEKCEVVGAGSEPK